MNVDWRSRFGRGWITSVRNQGNSQNCWAFATTALYEAMIRIEHTLWTRRSEGETARGTGKQAWDIGNIGEATIFVERYGLADPDCFPWGTAAALYTAKPHGPGLTALPLSPTPDRAGRTMRIPPGATITLTDIQQKKQWIDLVGPMAAMVTPPADFGAYSGTGIYNSLGQPGPAHALLIVGFNDDQQYWIVKNSFGTGWGDGGFGKISYNANAVWLLPNGSPVGFTGLRGTNPDPWAKRRLRNGSLVQGGNGALRNNFELFVRLGMTLEHWYRENADPKQPWIRVGVVRSGDGWRDTFHDDALDCPTAVQSSFNRNYELVYRSTYQRLRHVYFDHTSGWWNDATLFGPENPVGMPALIQSNRGAPGDFEVVVLTHSGMLEHWTKHNSPPWTRTPGEWYLQERFGQNIEHSGPGLVQSRLGVSGSPESGQGELHHVSTGVDGQMQHHRKVTGGTWTLAGTFGQGLRSAPVMIEGTYGAGNEMGVGNFELCVATPAGQIEHWWRYNTTPGPWTHSATFGSNVKRVVALLQSTYGANLEVIAELNNNTYQHYWRDGTGWNPGPVIV